MSIFVCDFERGCMNPNAVNFNDQAVLDDGSCLFTDACGEDVPAGDTSCYTDCADVPNGGAFLDDCGICSEGTTGHTANSDQDCNGVCNGTAWESDCGCVSANNSGDDCDDCEGVPNGSAEIDECGVCGGDGTSCDVHISIVSWYLQNINNQAQEESAWFMYNMGYNSYTDTIITYLQSYLNCVDTPEINCIDANVANMMHQFLIPTIHATTSVGFYEFDFNETITMKIAVSIKRTVVIPGVGESACTWIFGTETEPKISNEITYTSFEGLGGMDDPLIFGPNDPSGLIDLYQPVEINGTTYQLGQYTEFSAVYQMSMYIHEFEIENYDPDLVGANVTLNDINNPLYNEFSIYVEPYYDCAYMPGDVTGNGVVDCDDQALAIQMLIDDVCEEPDAETNPQCCAVWNLSPDGGSGGYNQTDLLFLVNLVADAGYSCS